MHYCSNMRLIITVYFVKYDLKGVLNCLRVEICTQTVTNILTTACHSA
jgi:hypothetical protein